MGDAVQRPKTEMELAKAIAEIIFSESAVLCDQLAEENELEPPRVLVETVICFFFSCGRGDREAGSHRLGFP